MTTFSLFPSQCQAARALCMLSRRDLAELAGVKPKQIRAFESFDMKATPENLAFAVDLRRYLEAEGAVFIDGCGVRKKIVSDLRDELDAPTLADQRYKQGQAVYSHDLSTEDFEKIGRFVETEYFIYDEKINTAYVELTLAQDIEASASYRSHFANSGADPDLNPLRLMLRSQAYLSAFFKLKEKRLI